MEEITFKLSQRSIDRLQGIHPILIEIAVEGIKDSPYDFGIPQDGGLRTAQRQNELFKKGVSKLDGFKKKGRHQEGKAFDIYAFVNGKASWDATHLKPIARHLQSIAKTKGVYLRWGGDWENFKDLPHFEML